MDEDNINCETIDVCGKIYRCQSNRPSVINQEKRNFSQEKAPAASRVLDEEDGEYEDDSTINEDSNRGGYTYSISADRELFGYIIGKQGSTKRKIEEETGATVVVPNKKGPNTTRHQQQRQAEALEVTVRGPTRTSVGRARTRLELIINQALGSQSLPYTHFISLPLASKQAVDTLTHWKTKVLGSDPTAAAALGLEESIFWPPTQLHLTVVMLKLYSAQAREAAQLALQRVKSDPRVASGAGVRVSLRGLEIMNDDPSDVNVLYLKVASGDKAGENLERLKSICDGVVESFKESGLVMPQDERPLKLHATVINTRLRRGDENTRKGFDASNILASDSDFDLGVQQIDSIHLSQRGLFDEDGYYHCVAKLPLNHATK